MRQRRGVARCCTVWVGDARRIDGPRCLLTSLTAAGAPSILILLLEHSGDIRGNPLVLEHSLSVGAPVTWADALTRSVADLSG